MQSCRIAIYHGAHCRVLDRAKYTGHRQRRSGMTPLSVQTH